MKTFNIPQNNLNLVAPNRLTFTKSIVMKRIYLMLSVVMLALNGLWAQDPHFSQFYAAPLEVNPAFSGIFDGQFKANINFRSQWASIIGTDAFRTLGASYAMKLPDIGDGDYFSMNINLLRDEAGTAKVSLTKANIGGSYHKKMWDGKYGQTPQYLIVGAQVGFGQYALNTGNLWFTNQFDPNTVSVDPNASSNEPWVTDSAPHFNFNIGGMWYSVLGEDFSIYAGGALQHLNQPNVSFYDNPAVLNKKITGILGGQIPITREVSLQPGIVAYSQGPAFQSVLGSHIRYSNHDWWEIALRAGAFIRIANKLDSGIQNDALIFSSAFEVERMTLGVSYDMNISSLNRSTNRRGAFELSLAYTQPNSNQRESIKCPKF